MRNIIMYWPHFLMEAWFTIRYYRAVRSIKVELEEADLRTDWIGRIYTVINLKEEFIKQPEIVQQSFVFQQLGPINKILVKHGLSNDAFPEISKISEESYLVVLYPENEDFNIVSFIRNILFAASVAGTVFGIIELVKYFM